MKNILAENLLRFGAKNISKDVKKKLTEQAEESNSNITLTDQFKDVKKPDIIRSDAGYVTLPKTGFPANGDVGIMNNEGVVMWLDQNMYMVLGKIGTYNQSTKSIEQEVLGIRIFAAEPWTSSDPSTGRPVNVTQFKYNVNDLPGLTAAIAKFVNGNNAAAAVNWLKGQGQQLVPAYNMATQFGLDTSILSDLNAYNTAVQKKITA